MAELARDEKAGRMVDVEIAGRRWDNEITIIRQIMLGVPASMAAALSGLSKHDTHVMETVMRDALTRCADEVVGQKRREAAAAKEVRRPGRRSRS